MASPGHRELGAVKISAPTPLDDPQNVEKKNSENFDFWGSRKSGFRHFSWILEELDGETDIQRKSKRKRKQKRKRGNLRGGREAPPRRLLHPLRFCFRFRFNLRLI